MVKTVKLNNRSMKVNKLAIRLFNLFFCWNTNFYQFEALFHSKFKNNSSFTALNLGRFANKDLFYFRLKLGSLPS